METEVLRVPLRDNRPGLLYPTHHKPSPQLPVNAPNRTRRFLWIAA